MNSIASFCREHRLPQRRVLREVKRELRNHADTSAEAWDVDLTEQIGVRAHREVGATRITYGVTNSEVLLQWVSNRMGLSLLEEEQIERIVDAARSLWKIGAGQDEDVGMYFRDTGNKAIYEDQYLAELDAALKRMGK